MSFQNPSESEEGLPDWLQNLQPDDDGSDADQSSSSEEGIPDWLADGEAAPEPPADQPSEEDIPDWLDSIRASEAQSSPTSPSAAAREEEGETGGEGEETPDWLQEIRNREAEEGDPQTDAYQVEEDSDFLERIRDLKTEDETIQEEVPGEGAPDWLAGISDEDVLIDQPAEEPLDGLADIEGESIPSSQSTGETPDWLAGLSDDSMPPVEPAQDIQPDWLSESETTGDTNQVPEEGQTPDWLASIAGDIPEFGEDEAEERQGDILADQAAAAEAVDEEFPGLPGEPGEISGDQPPWLSELQESTPDIPVESSLPPQAEPEEPVSAFAADDELEDEIDIAPDVMPDWLSGIGPGEDLSPPAEEADEGADIAPAELPSWLQAMRPVEAVAPVPAVVGPEEELDEITIGPLAGLRGVLPAEPDIIQFGRPPTYTIKLQVTTNQHTHAALFGKLVTSEGEPVPYEVKTVALPQRILRWIIASILFLLLLLSTISGSQNVPLPLPASIPETQDAYNVVNGLAAQSPVLVAFDYQPGLAGEMEAAASGVLDHLFIKEAEVVILSTNPTGPALGERLLAPLYPQDENGDNPSKNYTNLGYISGGTTALLSLATSPRTAMPVTVKQDNNNVSVWDLPPLIGISTLRDFSLLVILTDDPDTARAWVEQVQPHLVQTEASPETPMIMVLSAQAEPLVSPYYRTNPRQITGIVTSVAGGASYEAQANRPNIARTHWDTLGWGLTISVFILMFGGAYSIISSLLGRRKTPAAKEPA